DAGPVQHRRRAAAQPPHGEDEQVDAIGDQRQADDHLIGARTQQQPHAGAHQHADAERKGQFGHWASSAGTAVLATRSLRIDWCARAINISTVAPTTRAKTPRSKNSAVAAGTFPITGSSTYCAWEVRKG